MGSEDNGDEDRTEEVTSDSSSSVSLSNIADRLSGERGEKSVSQSSTPSGEGSVTPASEADVVSEVEGDASEWDVLARDDSTTSGSREFKTQAILDLIREDANILLSGPADVAAEYDLSSQLLQETDGRRVSAVLVLTSTNPEKELQLFQGYLRDGLERLAIITPGEISEEDVASILPGLEEIVIKQISDQQDLRRLGIVTSRQLSEWEEDETPTIVYLRSLSQMLGFIEEQSLVFRFIHILSRQVQSLGARAYYHMDPATHEDEVINTFQPLFDAVIKYDTEGSVSVG
jgi:hypothetical protein